MDNQDRSRGCNNYTVANDQNLTSTNCYGHGWEVVALGATNRPSVDVVVVIVVQANILCRMQPVYWSVHAKLNRATYVSVKTLVSHTTWQCLAENIFVGI